MRYELAMWGVALTFAGCAATAKRLIGLSLNVMKAFIVPAQRCWLDGLGRAYGNTLAEIAKGHDE